MKLYTIKTKVDGLLRRFRNVYYRLIFKSCGSNIQVDTGVSILFPYNVSIGNNVTINKNVFIQATPNSHIIIEDNVILAYNCMVLSAGRINGANTPHIYKNVTIENGALISARAIIHAGVRVGRESIIGAGADIRNNIPPYAIVVGNPCKIVGFSKSPEEIVEYEKNIYPEAERLPLELLEKNYEKYFLKRTKEIKEFTRI